MANVTHHSLAFLQIALDEVDINARQMVCVYPNPEGSILKLPIAIIKKKSKNSEQSISQVIF